VVGGVCGGRHRQPALPAQLAGLDRAPGAVRLVAGVAADAVAGGALAGWPHRRRPGLGTGRDPAALAAAGRPGTVALERAVHAAPGGGDGAGTAAAAAGGHGGTRRGVAGGAAPAAGGHAAALAAA